MTDKPEPLTKSGMLFRRWFAGEDITDGKKLEPTAKKKKRRDCRNMPLRRKPPAIITPPDIDWGPATETSDDNS